MEESFINKDNQVSMTQEKQIEETPNNHEEQEEPQPLTSKGGSSTFTKLQEQEPMVITIGKKKFKMVEVVHEGGDHSHDEKIADVLKIPAVKSKMKMGGVRIPGLPHVSDKKFQDILKEKDKKKKEAEKEKCKLECEAKAKAKQVEKAKKEAWRGLKHKRGQCKPVKQMETLSSEDSNVIEYNESSEYSSEVEESNYFNEGTSDRCVEW